MWRRACARVASAKRRKAWPQTPTDGQAEARAKWIYHTSNREASLMLDAAGGNRPCLPRAMPSSLRTRSRRPLATGCTHGQRACSCTMVAHNIQRLPARQTVRPRASSVVIICNIAPTIEIRPKGTQNARTFQRAYHQGEQLVCKNL